MNTRTNIDGLSQERLLQALWNETRPTGLGIPRSHPGITLTGLDCENLIKKGTVFYFDYGDKVAKVDVEHFDPVTFDSIVGVNAVENAIDTLMTQAA